MMAATDEGVVLQRQSEGSGVDGERRNGGVVGLFAATVPFVVPEGRGGERRLRGKGARGALLAHLIAVIIGVVILVLILVPIRYDRYLTMEYLPCLMLFPALSIKQR